LLDFACIPPGFTKALDACWKGSPRKDLAVAAERCRRAIARVRLRAPSHTAQALAYAVARMPATYAACARCSRGWRRLCRICAPSAVGCGGGHRRGKLGGGAAWPDISHRPCWIHNPALRALARKLADAGLGACRNPAGR
jgi:hypothetical protein